MWTGSEGGFNTVAVPDPLEYFTRELVDTLRAMSATELREVIEAVVAAGEQVFIELRKAELPPDRSVKYAGQPPPASLSFDLVPGHSVAPCLIQRVKSTPARWRLEAADLAEEAITVVIEEVERGARAE